MSPTLNLINVYTIIFRRKLTSNDLLDIDWMEEETNVEYRGDEEEPAVEPNNEKSLF